ncbi:MAG TPA: ABC transporter ATP-binding protein [Buttiauxella sp.]|nr:ABC transporter ATP-binding protein [Buttiauxella sp.]
MSLSISLQHSSTTVPVLELEDVTVRYRTAEGDRTVVEGVSFQINPGEVVALVGESGSGKTTTAQAVIGLLSENGRLTRGAIRLNGTDISRWSQKQLDGIRGARISLIPQDPTSSLNPIKTIGVQVDEILRLHQRASKKVIRQQTLALLARVGLTHPELRAQQYPYQLSGGMKQRVLIAIAIALKPALIIADEPTSALDVTVQKRVLDLLDDLRRESGTAILFVTHDLGVAAERADRLLVFQHGHVQEQGPIYDVLNAPRSQYARALLADVPSLNPTPRPLRKSSGDVVIRVDNLVQTYSLSGTNETAFRAVDNLSFIVERGTTHAIVGESGSGKTTTARSLLGFHRPTSGQILIDGTDITQLKGEPLRQFRKKIQLVYQNPFSSLDPAQRLFDIVEEPLRNFDRFDRTTRTRKVHEMFERVALPPELLTRKPHELSGGQRQRVAIARALILEPQVLVLDEAVSALDVTVQAQILRLLDKLQRDLGLTYLFISHDLSVVRQIADTVSVLHHGKQVESGSVEHIFTHSTDPYTRELIDAIPGMTHRTQQQEIL